VRNPAEYRKRAELATPSSVDKDFNFITNVERAITRADDGVLDRGLSLAPARQPRRDNVRPKVETEIEQRGVKVIRAPKVFSRAKQNKTHWVGQQQSIMWTIEWVCSDGEKIVGSALESRTLAQAYINIVGKKKIKRKRRLSQHDQPTTEPPPKLVKQEPHSPAKEEDVSNQKDGQLPGSTDEQLLAGMHIYLHNPQTSSKFKCLISLSPDQTLGAALEGRTVLEFPTIYVKNESPDQLEEPFISQHAYEKRHGDDIPVNLTAPLEDGEIDEPSGSSSAAAAEIAPEKVLEVLARDLS